MHRKSRTPVLLLLKASVLNIHSYFMTTLFLCRVNVLLSNIKGIAKQQTNRFCNFHLLCRTVSCPGVESQLFFPYNFDANVPISIKHALEKAGYFIKQQINSFKSLFFMKISLENNFFRKLVSKQNYSNIYL